MYKEIKQCRICGNTNLVPVLDLGQQVLTGVFPRAKDEKITMGPLELVKCHGDADHCCGLLQLKQSYESDEMYGANYGYRSGLNLSMVRHLHGKVNQIRQMVNFKDGDFVLDIGSNDGTLLQAYPARGLLLAGIDPSVKKFADYYPDHIQYIDDYFSAKAIQDRFGTKKAKVITSVSMFYDLERPIDFMTHIFDVLDEDGIWVFEQSYMPTMLKMNAYDTVCQEHLEYYSLRDIQWMARRAGFKIIDVEFNAVNGGSFSVTVAKKGNNQYKEKKALVDQILAREEQKGLLTLKPFEEFERRVFVHRDQLRVFIDRINREGKTIFGYGASTKGNVILQLCRLGEKDIPCVAEVNEEKFGCFTPGTNIPIVSEKDAKARYPDYFLVLPWHFRENFLEREKDWLELGGQLIFPLPEIEIVNYEKSVNYRPQRAGRDLSAGEPQSQGL